MKQLDAGVSSSRPVASRFKATRGDVHDEGSSAQFAYVSRKLRERVSEFVVDADLGPGSRVLDFGCATKPYAELFPASTVLVGADLEGNALADHCVDASGRLDVADESFDAILSTQVLEHVDAPSVYLAETFRTLKPGGHVLLTTHGLMYLHRDPADYWRWTVDGLIKIVGEQGFEVLAVDGLLGLVPAALQLIQDGAGNRVPRRLQTLWMAGFQRSISWIDRRYSESSRRENSLVVAVHARRPTD